MAGTARADSRYTVSEYFDLLAAGVIRPDDRVELLEGVIVAMSPQNPPHASAAHRAHDALRETLGKRAVVRMQLPLVLGSHGVPEPDVAVVPGTAADYDNAHPTTSLLIVEVADGSLLQDRLTKGAIYARAGIPEYWVVNLRDECIEILRDSDPAAGRYRKGLIARRGERIELASFPGLAVAADDLLPRAIPQRP
jgi:Uma2 family endonuclease